MKRRSFVGADIEPENIEAQSDATLSVNESATDCSGESTDIDKKFTLPYQYRSALDVLSPKVNDKEIKS